MFCRNCGKDVAENAKVCLGCGADPKGPGKFCFGCANSVHESAKSCTKCGANLASSAAGGKPIVVTIAGILMLVGAGLNLLTALIGTLYIFIFALGTYGIALLCCFIPLINILCALFELIFGIKLLGQKPKGNPFWVGIIEIITGIFSIWTFFGFFVLIIGIADMVMLLIKDAKDFLSS